MTIKKNESDGSRLIPKTALQIILGASPIFVYPDLAKIIGLENSVCWQQLNYWINDESMDLLKFEGRSWIYNTYERWQEELPFLSERIINRAFYELEKIGLILSYHTPKVKYYTIDYQALDSLLMGIELAKETDNDH